MYMYIYICIHIYIYIHMYIYVYIVVEPHIQPKPSSLATGHTFSQPAPGPPQRGEDPRIGRRRGGLTIVSDAPSGAVCSINGIILNIYIYVYILILSL